jgi:hypothetical protein
MYFSDMYSRIGFANDTSAYVPEWWANETLAVLYEELVAANLVYREFENELSKYGDVVNTRRPNKFVAYTKTDLDDVTLQDATATNVRVPLDQHIHTSFMIRDEELSKSFKDLINEFVRPAAQSLAQSIDRRLLGRAAVEFSVNSAGKLGELDSTNAVDYLLDLREVMNVNLAYSSGRNLLITTSVETEFLKNDKFTSAERVGDDGTALREASIGRKLGFDIFMCQNVNGITDLNSDVDPGTTSATSAAGSSTLTTGNADIGATTNGSFVTVEGDGQINVISSHTGSTTAITLVNPLKYDVASGAVVRAYKAAAVNGTQNAGYAKDINIDGHSANKGPQVGQLIAFGTGGSRHTYSVVLTSAVSSTETKVWLDRPLDATITNDDPAFPGPAGSICPAFHKNAIALVVRPLVAPPSNSGANATSMSDPDTGLAMRVTMQYQGMKQGMLVTMDLLCGIAPLDTDLGAVLLG